MKKTKNTTKPQTHLTYFLNDEMSRESLKILYNNFKNKDVEKIDSLNLILNTSGGSPSVAYQMAWYLRDNVQKITCYIPSGAFSSGVILALSADELRFGNFGHLAPIDVQTPSYTAGVGFDYDSTENLGACYDAVIEYGLDALDQSTKKIMQKSKLNISESIDATKHIIESVMKPVLDKIDPNKLGDLHRARDLGAYYAYYILMNMKKWEYEKAWDLAKFLSRSFPTHGFRILPFHLKKLGLPIAQPTSMELKGLNHLAFKLDEMEMFQGFVEMDEVLNLNQKSKDENNTNKKSKSKTT